MTDDSLLKCKFLHREEIWEYADKILKDYWEENMFPVNIEYIIEKGIGLDIIPRRSLYNICGIDAFLQSDFAAIVVDDEKYSDERYDNRLRFSFAHELGHFVLHDYVYQNGNIKVKTPEEYYNFIMNFPDKEYRAFEYQANQFAGRLLVPRVKLKEQVTEIFNVLKTEDLLHLFEGYSDTVLERATPKLSKPFGVSEDVIERRVREEGLWPPDELAKR